MKPFLFILVMFAVFSTSSVVYAQSKNIWGNEKIHLGGNEYIEILNCTGEAPTKRCELILLVNNKQVGNSFWLTGSALENIRKSRQTTAIPQVIPKTAAKTKPRVVSTSMAQSEALPQKQVQKEVQAEVKPSKPTVDFATQLNNVLRSNRVAPVDSSKKVDSLKN